MAGPFEWIQGRCEGEPVYANTRGVCWGICIQGSGCGGVCRCCQEVGLGREHSGNIIRPCQAVRLLWLERGPVDSRMAPAGIHLCIKQKWLVKIYNCDLPVFRFNDLHHQ